MRSLKTTAGANALATQYNNLRDDAKGAGALLAHQQSTLDMTLYVEAGMVYFSDKRLIFAGGNSPAFVAPTTNPRIDLLTIDSAGTLAIVQGTEAASPTAPAHPLNKIVICEVYNRTTEIKIYDEDSAGEGYILNDVRPFLAVGDHRQIISINFETAARYWSGVSGAGAAAAFSDGTSGGVVTFTSGSAANGRAALVLAMGGYSNQINLYDFDPEIYAFAQVPAIPAAGNTKHAYIFFGDVATDWSLVTTRKHFGFDIMCNNGVGEVYADYANGATQTRVLLSGITVTNPHRFYAKLFSGNRIEFWVDGVLKHTATADLPSGAPAAVSHSVFQAGVIASAGTSVYGLYQGPATVSFKAM